MVCSFFFIKTILGVTVGERHLMVNIFFTLYKIKCRLDVASVSEKKPIQLSLKYMLHIKNTVKKDCMAHVSYALACYYVLTLYMHGI